ncbi:enoyl-CoA hydratase-related protein [Virgibacillus halophilus]|uniref:enoyl-CoA hydratase-related protein n=1 Tax=Tigheibacillus halophilus TaxID=361280 RepID=UPI0036303948
MPELVELHIRDTHIAEIVLNRPEAANAMSRALLDELNKTIEAVNMDKNVYCTVIHGAGGKAFCAGADLKERKNMTPEQVVEAVTYIGQTITNIENMQVPVIAAINGAAYGGGLELALACDIRIAALESKMGLTETSLAIIPGAGGTQRLPRLIGVGSAKQLIFTAKPIHAETALNIGLVQEITEGNALLKRALDLAGDIAGNGPLALIQAKAAINQGVQTDLIHGLQIEHDCYQQTIATSDRLEGLAAFQEKRKPVYEGK